MGIHLFVRFKIRLPEGLSQAEEENMESEAVIPTRLRLVHQSCIAITPLSYYHQPNHLQSISVILE